MTPDTADPSHRPLLPPEPDAEYGHLRWVLIAGKNGLIVTFRNRPDPWLATQFKSMTLVGSAEVVRFGTMVQGYDVYYATDYTPETEDGVQGE